MAYGTYQDLEVWQRAMDLVVGVYELTRHFPPDERFGLTSQMRRSAVSIPSNIPEGHGRQSQKEFPRFLWNANGSLAELETQLAVARRLDMATNNQCEQLRDQLQQVGRMLGGLRSSLERRSPQRPVN